MELNGLGQVRGFFLSFQLISLVLKTYYVQRAKLFGAHVKDA